MIFILAVFLGYLLGSIPFGLILTKLAGMGDIRAIGSGNIGATNVLRTGNKKLAALVLLLDGAKGWLAVFLACHMAWRLLPSPNFGDEQDYDAYVNGILLPYMLAAGIAAILGHVFPVWLKFKGGKGVATALGVYLGVAWPVGLAAIECWLLVFAATRISSFSALISLCIVTPALCFFIAWPLGAITLLIGLLIACKHRANIRRLLKGEEPRFGRTKSS